MSKSELAQYRKAQKLSLSYKTFGIPMSYNDYIQIMNKKVKDDKDSTTKSKNKSKSSFSKSVNPFLIVWLGLDSAVSVVMVKNKNPL